MSKLRRIGGFSRAKVLGFFYDLEKAKATRTRKLPLLPRVGVVVDFAGYELTVKFAPLFEAILSLPERGFTAAALREITKEQLSEICVIEKAKAAVIDTSARSVSS